MSEASRTSDVTYGPWQPEEESGALQDGGEFEDKLESVLVGDPDESDREYVVGELGSLTERLGPERAREYARAHSLSHYVRARAARRMGRAALGS